jgi:hypothetical protein
LNFKHGADVSAVVLALTGSRAVALLNVWLATLHEGTVSSAAKCTCQVATAAMLFMKKEMHIDEHGIPSIILWWMYAHAPHDVICAMHGRVEVTKTC